MHSNSHLRGRDIFEFRIFFTDEAFRTGDHLKLQTDDVLFTLWSSFGRSYCTGDRDLEFDGHGSLYFPRIQVHLIVFRNLIIKVVQNAASSIQLNGPLKPEKITTKKLSGRHTLIHHQSHVTLDSLLRSLTKISTTTRDSLCSALIFLRFTQHVGR